MKIFDPLRKKYVELTPEEEVRQGVIATLVDRYGFPKHLVSSEYAFKAGQLDKRADIVAFDRNLTMILLVECKKPEVTLDNAVIDQVIGYNMVLKVKYILITNGKTAYLCKRGDDGTYKPENHFPTYSEMCND